jgi:LysM repeat protein
VLPSAVPPAGQTTHTVAAGENLFRISLKYNVTLQALMQANGITNPNLVYVGQVLRIP